MIIFYNIGKDDNIQKDEAQQSDRQTMTNISDFTFTIKETKINFDIMIWVINVVR